MWSSLAAACHATASQLEKWPPKRGTPNPTPRWEWRNSSLWRWRNGLRCATRDICPTVVEWGMRVLFCPFCPRQKVASLCKQAPLGARKQAALHRRSLTSGVSGYPALGSGRVWPAARETNSSSFWKTEGGGQSPCTCWNKIIRFRLGMPICFSCADPAGTPVVPSRDCKTSHRGDRSHCCKTGIALVPNLICKVRERIWILNMNFKALPVSSSHSPTAPVHANLPRHISSMCNLSYISDNTPSELFFFY